MTDRLEARDGTILIVCTGNVCRSPYIERLLAVRIAHCGISVSSAGTNALVGAEMDPRVARRLTEVGADPSDFLARQLTADLVQAADLVLCATRAHRSAVVRMEPRALRRVYALADFSDLAAHLADSDVNGVTPAVPTAQNLVREVSEMVALGRSEVQPRTAQEAEIVDPYGRPAKVLDQMLRQVDALVPPIGSVLASRAELRHAEST